MLDSSCEGQIRRTRAFKMLQDPNLAPEDLTNNWICSSASDGGAWYPYFIIAAGLGILSTEIYQNKIMNLDPVRIKILTNLHALGPRQSWSIWWLYAGFSRKEIKVLWKDAGFKGPMLPMWILKMRVKRLNKTK